MAGRDETADSNSNNESCDTASNRSQVFKPELPKNLMCTFRAPTPEEYLEHRAFCKKVKEDGLDICRVLLGFERAYLEAKKGAKEAIKLQSSQQVVNIYQNNQFVYQVSKPRREPYSLDCVKPEFRRTIGSIFYEAYILN
jgi:hypothetical protein